MPSPGDLVSNLIMDSSGYTSGVNAGVSANRVLSGSIDSMIGQLQRQKRAFDDAQLTNRDRIISRGTSGDTGGKVAQAIDLLNEAEDRNATKRINDANDAIKQLKNTFGMSRAEIDLHNAKLAGVPDSLVRLLAARVADEKAARAQIAANQTGSQVLQASLSADAAAMIAIDKRSAALKQERVEYNKTTDEIEIYRMELRGASAEEIQFAKDAQLATRALREKRDSGGMLSRVEWDAQRAAAAGRETPFDRMVREKYAETRRQNSMHVNADQDPSRKGIQFAMEAVRGFEDLVSGATFGGFRGAIMGVTNNLTQMASIIGGNAGVYMGLAAVGGLIATTVVPRIWEMIHGTQALNEAFEKQIAIREKMQAKETSWAVARVTNANSEAELLREMADKQQRGRDPNAVRDEQRSVAKSIRDEEAKITAEKARQEEIAKQSIGTVNKYKEAALDRQGETGRTMNDFFKGFTFGLFDDNKAIGKTAVNEFQELETKRLDKLRESRLVEEESVRQIALLKKQEEQLLQEQKITNLREQARIDGENLAMEMESRRMMANIEKEWLQKQVTDNKAISSVIEGEMKRLSPKLGEMWDIKQKQKEIEKYGGGILGKGILSDAEVAFMKQAVEMKPDMPPGSPGAVQAGTREAYSSIVRAMKAGEQAKILQEQKVIAEKAQLILERIATATEKAQLSIEVDF